MPLRLPIVLRFGPGGVRRLRANLGEADRAMANGDWPVAETRYAATLAIDPARWPLHVQRGHALKEQGYLRRAEGAYRQALSQKADVADTHLQLGHVLKLQGRIAEAFAAYQHANRLAPGDAHSRRELDALADAPRRDPERHAPAAIARLLEAADLPDALLPLFDEVFYLEANPTVRHDLPAPDRVGCLAHFCELGLAALLPFNAALVFDPVFYRDTALGGRAMPPASAYRHWLTIGLAQGRAPNRLDWLERTCGIGRRRATALPPKALDALVDIETHGAWIDGFDAMQAAGALAPSSPGHRALHDAFADRAARFASADAAGRATGTLLDSRLLALDPDHAGAMGRTAERLRREGFATEARTFFARLVGSPARSVDATLGLAACQEAVGDLQDALDTLAAGRAHFRGDTRLDRAMDALAPRLLHRTFRLAMAQGLAGGVAAADAALTRAVAHVIQHTERGLNAASTPIHASEAETTNRDGHRGTGDAEPWHADAPLLRRPIRRLAIVGNGDLPQCRFYRITGKLEQLAALGIDATFHDVRDGIPDFLGALHVYDAAIFYRVAADAAVIAAITRSRSLGLLTIYETDDLLFDAAHYPPSLASYGGAVDAREHMGLRLGVPLMAAAMRLCDVGLASTPALAEAMRGFVRSGEVFVHRNALGLAHEAAARRPRVRRDESHVTILYGSGTKAHAEDFDALVAPALVEIVGRHGPRVRIVLVGHVPATSTLEAIGAHITRHPTLSLDAFWALLAEADINLAVLRPSAMADAKSEIKWLEAAMLGVPSVVSDTAAMRDAVRPGIDGFLCATPEDWVTTLDALVRDPALRRAVGAQAEAAARQHCGRGAATARLGGILEALAPPPRPARPKLLVVNVYYPPQTIGGATRVVRDNVAALQADGGFEVAVFTTTDGGQVPYALSTYAEGGIRVTAATVPPRDDIDRLLDDPAMGAAFAGFIAQTRPDFIHFHCIQRLTIAVIEAAQAAGIPYVITAHDGWWVSDEQFIVDRYGTPMLYDYDAPTQTGRHLGPSAEARLRRLAPALRGAQGVLAVSESFGALHRRCGVPRVRAVPNGLSGDIVAPRRAATLARIRLGFVGGLQDHKGWTLLAAALRATPFDGFELLVVDHALPAGGSEETLFGATPVRFVPRTPPEAMGTLYAGIDVLLAPSIWPESFGLVAREALACGCWVIASDRGAIGADVVPGENGFVVDVASPAGLTAALQAIAADPDRYRRPPALRAQGRTAADQGRDLGAIYRALLA